MPKSLIQFQETLPLPRSASISDTSGLSISPSSEQFSFPLCRRDVNYGDFSFPHFWMDTRVIYGDRKRSTKLHRLLIEYYWARCTQESTTDEKGVQESYILAFLLPHARSHGSRRVLVDATHSRRKNLGADKTKVISELEQLLYAGRDRKLNNVEFRDCTANAIGPPLYDQTVQNRYRDFDQELFEEGRASLQKDGPAGLQVPLKKWKSWMKSIGRRGGKEQDKEILDILSYECRAALHRCYSAVWWDLIQHLQKKYSLSREACLFHQLWHWDPILPSNRPQDGYFHLFHGHIFGLHPGCGDFMLTKTGPQLVGNWLEAPNSEETYGRLLQGLAIAIDDYARRNQIYAMLRKKQPDSIGGQDLVRIEEQQVERRSGRHRPKRRKRDAS